jgi:hypothetical protein
MNAKLQTRPPGPAQHEWWLRGLDGHLPGVLPHRGLAAALDALAARLPSPSGRRHRPAAPCEARGEHLLSSAPKRSPTSSSTPASTTWGASGHAGGNRPATCARSPGSSSMNGHWASSRVRQGQQRGRHPSSPGGSGTGAEHATTRGLLARPRRAARRQPPRNRPAQNFRL